MVKLSGGSSLSSRKPLECPDLSRKAMTAELEIELERQKESGTVLSSSPRTQAARPLGQSRSLPIGGWACLSITQWALQAADTWVSGCLQKVLNRGLWPLAFADL